MVPVFPISPFKPCTPWGPAGPVLPVKPCIPSQHSHVPCFRTSYYSNTPVLPGSAGVKKTGVCCSKTPAQKPFDHCQRRTCPRAIRQLRASQPRKGCSCGHIERILRWWRLNFFYARKTVGHSERTILASTPLLHSHLQGVTKVKVCVADRRVQHLGKSFV